MSKIINVPMKDQYIKDSIDYLIEANRRRAIPDYKDGFKPVQRRIIDVMYNDIKCIHHTVKSAKIVGVTMGKSHPHGDMAIYQSMKPMANWFETNIPYIISQGGFGNFQGDSMSAPRYTEARLSEFTMDCVIGELKETNKVVDWSRTFDDRDIEPNYFPVTVPTLLIQGAFGIGYGMKVEIPKHNIGDVIDATIKLMENPNAKIELIPDQSMKTLLMKSDFKAISNKGSGKFMVKGLIEIDEYKGYPRLTILSTPDLVFLNSVTDKIENLIKSKELQNIHDMDDESSEDQMKYTILLKKGTDPYYIRDVIYKKTEMQKAFNVNFEVLDGHESVRMSYKSYLQAFILFRKTTKFRLYCNKLKNANTKFHEKDAFIKVLQSGKIDQIITKIRKHESTDDAPLVEYLIKELDITDLQAKYIIKANLRQLSLGNLNKLIEQANKYQEDISSYYTIIHNEEMILQEIKQELLYLKKKYNKPRNTTLIEMEDDLIPKGEFNIIITENNCIKKIPTNFPVNVKGDTVRQVMKVDNQKSLLVFDDLGKVYKLPIHKVQVHDKNSNGTDIRLLINKLTSNIVKVIYEPLLEKLSKSTDKYFLTMVTSCGNIKKMDLDDFLIVLPSGLVAFKLDDNDSVKDVTIIYEHLDVIVYSKDKALRFNMKDIPHQKRNNKGQRSMQTGNFIDGMSIIDPNTTEIIIVTDKGKVNRFSSVALPLLIRNKPGVDVIKLTRGDGIKAIHTANISNNLNVITADSEHQFKVEDIPIGSSISPGTKMIPLSQGNVIIRTYIN